MSTNSGVCLEIDAGIPNNCTIGMVKHVSALASARQNGQYKKPEATAMADIVITEMMDADAVEWLRQRFSVHYDPMLVNGQEEIPGLLQDARALIVRDRTWVSADFISMVSHLECIGRIGVVFDNIDVNACEASDIALVRADGANNRSVAEYVLATAMILMRGAYSSTEQVRSGMWPRNDCIGREIAGKTIGLLGYGEIGRSVARLAGLFGLTVLAEDPFVPDDDPAWQFAQRTSMDDLLQRSDIVSVHAPHYERTHHMVSAEALGRMKHDAVLISATRGGVVDEFALAAAMRAGHLTGAAIDVFEQEPVPGLTGERFEGLPNLMLTPRIAGHTVESAKRLSMLIAERVASRLS